MEVLERDKNLRLRIKKYLILFALSISLFLIVKTLSGVPGTEDDPVVTKSYVEHFYNFRVVEIMQNQTLILGAGTEVIARVGRAKVIDSKYGGLVDLTAGVELKEGSDIPNNHLIFSPKGDGRGMKAKTKFLLLVKGRFEIR